MTGCPLSSPPGAALSPLVAGAQLGNAGNLRAVMGVILGGPVGHDRVEDVWEQLRRDPDDYLARTWGHGADPKCTACAGATGRRATTLGADSHSPTCRVHVVPS